MPTTWTELRPRTLAGGTERGSRIPSQLRQVLPGRFINHLLEAGVAMPPNHPRKSRRHWTVCVRNMKSTLRRQRGTCRVHDLSLYRFLERFLAFRFGDKLGAT